MSGTQMFEPLINLLEQQLAQYAHIYGLAERKRQYLIAPELEKLEQTVREETSALSKARMLEKKRLELMAELRRQLGLEQENISLNELISVADEAAATQLKDIQLRFGRRMTDLLRLNKANSDLLQMSIDYNEMMIDLMLGSEDPLNNFYEEDGSQSEERTVNPNFFDQQV